MLEIENTLQPAGLTAGIVVAHGVRVAPSPPELPTELEALVMARASQDFPPREIKDAVRALLRGGGYKPSGRGKPASEYLAQAAGKGTFPSINALVDVNNLVSLASGLPSSMLDLSAFEGHLRLRYGRAGERYVFNAAGQEIDLEGLIVACRGTDDRPLGNPVKDSLEGKIADDTDEIVGVVYAPAALGARVLDDALATFTTWLGRVGAESIESRRV